MKLFLFLIFVFHSITQADIIFKNGFESDEIFFDNFDCDDFGDNDSDRIINCYETNTMIYVDKRNTGTDPNNPDTDGDSINDGDEVLGTLSGLNLPLMGVNPLVKNILIEYDWFDDSLQCGAHSHRPTNSVDNRVKLAFLNAPNVNADGSTGIVVINDYGQGGVFTGGNLIEDEDGVIEGGVNGSVFAANKNQNFANNREGYFHYTLLPHRYNTDSGSSGQAELNGDDLIVSLYCANSDRNVAHTILHEIGHNFSFLHGGNSFCNYKPNYNSVMNYKFQFPGADNDCDGNGDSVLDYSRGLNAALDESNLDENMGICNSQPIDWDDSGMIESSIVFDINSDDGNQVSACGSNSTISVLEDYDDWANINLSGILDFDRGLKEIITCQGPP